MEYLEARVDGNEVILKLRQGSMRLPLSAVSEESRRSLAGNAPPEKVRPVSKPDVSTVESPAPVPKEEIVFAPAATGGELPARQPRPELWEFLPRALSPRPESGERFKTRKIEFEVTGKLFENPKVKVQCLVPVDAGNRPLPGAADVVFYAPYQNQKDPVVTDPFVREIAEIYGMTVFSLTIKTNQSFFEDHEKCYYYAESGSYDMVLKAWDKVVEQLRIPRKNLLVAANSAGSTMAQRFALLNAQRVDAVSMIGGWRYEPMREPNAIAWCVLCTRGDIREPANVELAAQARSLGVSMLQAVTPLSTTKKEDFSQQYTSATFHHVASTSAFDIAQQFLAAVRDMRSANKDWKNIPLWPLRAPLDSQWAVEKNEGPPASLSEAAYLPSEPFAATWLRNEYRSVIIPSAEGGSRRILLRYPQKENPKGIIIYGGGGTEIIDRGDDMDFLGLQGFLVVGMPDEDSGRIEDARELLQWVVSLEQWKAFPIFLLGFNEAGRNFLTLLPECDPGRVKSAAVIDAPLPGASDAPPKTPQKVYLSSLDEDPSDREPFISYLKRTKEAGVDASVIALKPDSKLPRFDLLEDIAGKFSP